MGIPISDMTENRNWDMLPGEELFKIPDEFADPFSRHHHIIDKVNGFLFGIESIECGIEGLAGLPQLFLLLKIEGDYRIGRKTIPSAHLGHTFSLRAEIGLGDVC